jgi:hypothetical protein
MQKYKESNMKDRFKFRAWLKQEKRMVDVRQITDMESVHYIKFEKWNDSINCPTFAHLEDIILLQCTGLKDKNGKLIYEGDIVTSCNGHNFFINFEYGSFGAQHIGSNTWYSSATCSFHEKKFQVIGNVHLNPELLKGDKND